MDIAHQGSMTGRGVGTPHHPRGADPPPPHVGQGGLRQSPTLPLRPQSNQFIMVGFLLTKFFQRHETAVASQQCSQRAKGAKTETRNKGSDAWQCPGPEAGCQDRHRPRVRKGGRPPQGPWDSLSTGQRPLETLQRKQQQ